MISRMTLKLADISFLMTRLGLPAKASVRPARMRVQADAWWRVVAQLVAQLTADTVADAGFVGGQIYFGHDTAPL
jgi:hypothetical protein